MPRPSSPRTLSSPVVAASSGPTSCATWCASTRAYASRRAAWERPTSCGADGERGNIGVLRKALRSFGRLEDGFDWVRDRPGHDRCYAIDSVKLRRELGWEPSRTDFAACLAKTIRRYRGNKAWWRPAKEATEVRYRVQGW